MATSLSRQSFQLGFEASLQRGFLTKGFPYNKVSLITRSVKKDIALPSRKNVPVSYRGWEGFIVYLKHTNVEIRVVSPSLALASISWQSKKKKSLLHFHISEPSRIMSSWRRSR